MTSLKSVAFLLLLSSVFFALNFTPYFLDGEANVIVTYSNFSIGSDIYSIVSFNSVNTFLLKNDVIVTDESEFDSVLYSYYLDQYYPTQSEIDDLKAAIQTFNDSRNDGYDFANKEEYSCRDDVLLSNGKIIVYNEPVVCSDEESCTTNAMLLYSVYATGLGLGSIDDILDPLMAFTPSSLKMDAYLQNYTTMLDSIDSSTLVSTLNYISSTAPELHSLSEDIEYTVFRTPKLNDSEDRADCMYVCWAICPSFDLDQDAADAIASKASALATKVAPINNFESSSTEMYGHTLTRIEYATTVAMASNYSTIFAPLNETSIETITAATDILTHVVNPTLTYKLSQLQALHESIPDSIEQKNFTNLSDDIETYETLISEISNLTNTSYDQYNRTLTAKNNENLLILVLETKDLDPITVSSLEILKAQSDDLNVQFRDGLTIDELAALEGNYTELSEQAQELLQNEGETPSKKAASMFRGLARRINVGIANFVDTNGLIPRSELSENSLALGAFSLITFLSSASFVILFFVYLFALDNFVVPKTSQIIAVALFSLLVILFLFSGFLFIFLDKTSTDATFTEFLSDFSSKDSAAIVVDLRNTTISDATAMQGCANKFANTLSGQNKTWTIYSLGSSTCTIYEQSGTNSTANIADCETSAADSDSSFIFSYSDIDSLTFSIIYENKAEISADKNYYDSCPLTVMFG